MLYTTRTVATEFCYLLQKLFQAHNATSRFVQNISRHIPSHNTTVEMGDLLERFALRLNQAEPAVESDEDVEQSPQQERAPSQILDHVRGRQTEDEVEEPLTCDAGRHAELTGPSWEDLGWKSVLYELR